RAERCSCFNMTDSRKAMMDKFEKMKARQNAAKENRNRRLNQELCSLRGKQRKSGEVSSRRLKKKNIWNVEKKDDDMSSKRDRKYMTNLIDGIFMSLRERKRKRYIDEKCKKGKIKSISTPDETKLSRDFPSTDAQKESFCKFLSEIFGLGVQGLLQQYQTYLKTYVPPDVTRVAFDKNMERNRYKDVVCIDQTRVILKNTNQDYIHASHVRGEPFVNPFICTQGPMKNTVDDFWIMVMQERVSHIFMLCNVTESGKSRCAQYWPPDVGGKAEHAGVIIRNLHVDDDDSTLVITKLDAEGRGEHLSLKHLRWKNWPDKGVPLSVLAPFRLLTMSRQSTNRPTIVHCSAGIGRTGCIVATEMCIQLLLTLKPFSIIRAIQQLRSKLYLFVSQVAFF
uniref:SH2 domain-containing protein n=2 Tax=Parascaris TaxID=6254 RepID=A0A914ZCI5_PARUN